MRSLFRNLTGIQNDDLVRSHDRGQTVGDHDDGAIFCQRGKGLLDHGLVLGVGKSRGLIQHHDGRVLQNGPGQRHALLLTAGEISPLGADHRVHPLGELFEDIVTLGSRQRPLHLFLCCLWAGGAHVLQDAGLEEAVVLEHKGHLIHQHVGVGFAHIHAADLHRAGAHIPEAGNETGRGGLAAAGGADQGNRLPRLDPERNVIKRGQCGALIGKAHVLKCHAVVLRCLRMVRDRKRGSAHDLVDAPQSGAGQHHAAGRKHDLGQGRGNDGGEDRIEGEVRHESREIAGLQSSRCD